MTSQRLAELPAIEDPNAVAVIGLACRFGPACSAADYWQLLRSGASALRRWDHGELLALGHSPEVLGRPGFVPAGCVLTDADAFDQTLFGLSPQAAEWLDPQQRQLLELSWAALEDGGFCPTGTGLRTGVFASVGQPLLPPVGILDLDAEGMLRFSSADKDFAATRLSYALDLTGPSLTVQTACSSSLVAVHLAAESLLGHECDLALVAGASVHLPQAGYLASRDMILSPTGRCRPFDQEADGTVFGNGAAAVVLRRLSDALADGDPVRAVLRGSAVNNDGAGKLDFHAPSPRGQAAVIREALGLARVDPASIGYVEAHGTGTPLGDPVELGVLARVFGCAGPCAVGSAKSVVGHLNTAAGLAGVIKSVLALEAGTVPPQAGFGSLTTHADFGESGLFVATHLQDWPVPGPRRAAVSSFGIGGTNAHLVLEQAPHQEHSCVDGPQLVPLSAASAPGLAELARRLADHLAGAQSPLSLRDVAHTLRVGRAALPVRAVVQAESLTQLVASLRTLAQLEPPQDALAWIAREGELPPGTPGRRVRLPGYPFARNRWPMPTPPPPVRQIRGLSWRNVSTLAGFRLAARLDPTDPLIAEHRVNGEPVAPAAAQLDALFTVATEAVGRPVTELRSVVFSRALRALETLVLTAEADLDGHVRLRSESGEHAVAQVAEPPAGNDAAGTGRLDLTAITSRCPRSIQPAEVYQLFQRHGIEYGQSFRVITELLIGPQDVLATVQSATEPGYSVAPRLLDGALQAVLGFAVADAPEPVLQVPFSIDQISVPTQFPDQVRVHLRRAGTGGRLAKFDVVVTGTDGAVLARLDGLALRPATAAARWPAAVHLAGWRELEYDPVDAGPWPGPLMLVGALQVDPALASGPVYRYPVPADPAAAERLGAEIAASCPERRPLIVTDPGTGLVADRAVALLALVRGLAQHLGRVGVRVVVACPDDPVLTAGVAALGRSLVLENPRLEVMALEANPVGSSAAIRAWTVPAAHHHRQDGAGRCWTYRLHKRNPGPSTPLITTGGRYWLHGYGAVGRLLAEHLIRAHRAHLVLTARREPDMQLHRLRELAEQLGVSVTYHVVDATDEDAVRALAKRIPEGGPPVRGVLHCAAITRDAFLIRSTSEADRAVLAPKLTGATILDAVTAGWPLDFFLTMSSVSGVLGSRGQGSYAFANAALERFTLERDRWVAEGKRHGRSLSVAWPYWAAGGIPLAADLADALTAYGMTPMQTPDALATFDHLLAAGDPRPVLLSGDWERIRAAFPVLDAQPEPAAPAPPDSALPDSAVPDGAVPERTAPERTAPVQPTAAVVARIAQALAGALRTPVEMIGSDTSFDSLGVDSLTAVRVVEALEPDFGSLSKTLLFEARTVGELADQLVTDHPDRAGTRSEPAQAELTHAELTRAELTPSAHPDAIAVIGVAGRFPDADDLDELWANLRASQDSIREVPRDRWDAQALYRAGESVPGRTITKWGGFLRGVDKFDAPLFHISPREASIIDPQARLFLETCWAVFEDAGYRPEEIVGPDQLRPRDVGVFAGVMYGEYQLHEAEERLRGNPIMADSGYWSIANRVSYFFDLQGPSVAVDTACSSALSAIQLACDALRAGRCAVAVAGGVNVSVHPNKYFMLSDGRFGSSDGRCRSFGAGGDGYVPGEGVGAVLLKPLQRALADGDHLHAVIRGSAVNHGGRTNGYTVPNAAAQANLVTAALRDAGLSAADIDYVEAHGTGTSLGDPIEIRGLTIAFDRDGAGVARRVPIGSVKSNVGHLESAAGMVSLVKVLLQMRHRTLVPSLHCDPPNPEIDFARSPFDVQRTVAEWHPQPDRPLRAAISSFGAGGANAHLIVEQAPPRPAAEPAGDTPVLLFLSARTDAALGRYAVRLAEYLAAGQREGPTVSLRDVAFTFATGRAELSHRLALRAATLDELVPQLRRVAAGPAPSSPSAPAGAPVEVARWLTGAQVDLLALSGSAGGRRIPLPHYPFERIRCWYDLQLRHLADNPDVVAEPQHRHLRDFGLKPESTGPEPSVTTVGPQPPLVQDVVELRPLAAAPETRLPPHPDPPRLAAPAGPSLVVSGSGLDLARMREVIREQLASVLYMSPTEIAEDETFQALGVDSVLGVELVSLLNTELGRKEPATVLYDHPTPWRLAEHLAGMPVPVGTPEEAGDGDAPSLDALLDALSSGEITVEQATVALRASSGGNG